jgi:YD repeat-containing protein
MTRRRWFASLFATLLGAWGAARARAVPPPSLPEPAAAGGRSVSYYYYDAADRLFAIRDEPGMVTTYVYDCSGRPSTGC